MAATIELGQNLRMARRNTGALRVIKRTVQNPKAVVGITVVTAVIIAAIFAEQLAPFDPTAQNLSIRLSAPSWSGGPPGYWLGTDALGRDILSRLIFGARISVIVGLASVAFQGGLGVGFGLVAGYYGGRADSIIMRIGDVQLALPFLILALAIVAALGTGLQNIVIALGLSGWVLYGRTVRSEVLSVKQMEFVLAARALGASDPRILGRHLLPNIMASVVVIGTLQIARMIISEASLSYLGLGIQAPTPAWGSMVAEGRDIIDSAWWVATIPGLAILVTVLGINFLGDYLRDILDPRSRWK